MSMCVTTFIDRQLDRYRDSADGKLKLVDDNFVFAYGPCMCMYSGYFEQECDEIARYNKYMQLMVHAAYLIRRISSGNHSYADAKIIIKNFIISIENAFDEHDEDLKEVLRKYANDYLIRIRNEQKARGDMESFIVNACPIVPYNTELRKVDEAEENLHADIIGAVKATIKSDLRTKIITLLLDNLADIMMNTNLTVVLYDEDNSFDRVNLIKLDNLTKRNNEVSLECQQYYFLSTVKYYGLQDNVAFDKYMNFFEEAGDFSKTKSFAAFESMIENMAEATNIDIAAESWDDPSMDSKEEMAVSQLVQSHTSYIQEKSNEIKYDFGVLNDFINVKRYMKFEEYPNRLFEGSLEKTRIVNVNIMGMERNYYEMDNNTVACPFLDLRTYQVRVIVLHANNNEIEIIDDIREMY